MRGAREREPKDKVEYKAKPVHFDRERLLPTDWSESLVIQ